MGKPTLFERFCEWLAWKLPTELIYWCVVRGFADASVEKYTNKTPDEITVFQVMGFLANKRFPESEGE